MKPTRMIVGLSGGVDSAVTASLADFGHTLTAVASQGMRTRAPRTTAA